MDSSVVMVTNTKSIEGGARWLSSAILLVGQVYVTYVDLRIYI